MAGNGGPIPAYGDVTKGAALYREAPQTVKKPSWEVSEGPQAL